MRSYLITLKSNKSIRQYVMECNNSSMKEENVLEMFFKYEDIHWEEEECLENAEIRTL